ncbi:MAG: hypothetical protein IJ667_00705 [Synergistaceae bacterium]|nr:hypothetical protein [Synergistaceae bacterium]
MIRRRGKVFSKILISLLGIIILVGGLLAFTDLGGDMVLKMAQEALRKNSGLELNASAISGNPIKGYTLKDLNILDLKNNKEILSSPELKARLDLPALMTGLIRVIIHDSVIKTEYGTFKVDSISAALRGENLELKLDSEFNNINVTGEVDAQRQDDNLIINKANFKPGSGALIVTGDVDLKDLNLNLTGSAQGINLKEIAGLLKFLNLNQDDFDGTINSEFTAKGKGSADNLNLTGSLDYKGRKLAGYPVQRVTSNFNYLNNKININNLQASLFNIPISGEASAVLKNNNLDSVNIKLDGGAANLDGFVKDLTGKVSAFNVNISGNINSLNGTVNFNAPQVAYQGYKINNIAMQLKLANSANANLNGKFNYEGAQGYLQGSVANLLNKPNLNLTAKLVDFDIKRAASMIPDASQYKLDGKVTAALNIKGSASNPSISGNITSPALAAAGNNLSKLDVNFAFANNALSITKGTGNLNNSPVSLTGKISNLNKKNPDIDFNLSSPSFNASEAKLNNLSAKITGNVNNLNANISAANLSAGGASINNLSIKASGSLDNLNANINAANLSASELKLNNLSAKITGDLNNNLNADISANSLSAGGINFNNLNTKLVKKGNNINFSGLNLKSPAGNIALNGSFNTANNNLNFKINADALDLAKLVESMPDVKGQLSGTANLDFNLTGNLNNLQGSGALKSNAVKAYGLSLSNVNMPLSYSGAKNSFASSKATANLYGGSASNNFSINLSNLKFNDDLSASGFEINDLIKDLAGKIGGNVTGKGKLNLKLSGDASKNVRYSGNGTFAVGTGAITGFKWLDLATRLYNSKGINYQDINVPFTLQTGKLILAKNSAANAVKNDRIYKFAKLTSDSAINFANSKNITLNILADLSLNYQLVNALAGGGAGGLDAVLKGGSGAKDILLNAISGGIKGAKDKGSAADFRTISIKLTGKADSPSFSILKIGDTTVDNIKKQAQEQETKKIQAEQDAKAKAAAAKEQAKEKAKEKAKEVKAKVNEKKDKLVDKAADKIADVISKGSSKNNVKASSQTNSNSKQETKDKIKENINKGIEQGLNNLFNKSKKK